MIINHVGGKLTATVATQRAHDEVLYVCERVRHHLQDQLSRKLWPDEDSHLIHGDLHDRVHWLLDQDDDAIRLNFSSVPTPATRTVVRCLKWLVRYVEQAEVPYDLFDTTEEQIDALRKAVAMLTEARDPRALLVGVHHALDAVDCVEAGVWYRRQVLAW